MVDPAQDSVTDAAVMSPDEAFSCLGNETRIAILRALWDAYDPTDPESNAVPFSELYRDVGADDSGKFNYHLGQLVGQFVQQTPDGYELTNAGVSVIRSIVAGIGIDNSVLEPAEILSRCPYCQSPVEMSYQEETLSIRCTECPGAIDGPYPRGTIMDFGIPPAGLIDRTREDVVRAAHVFHDAKTAPMIQGVCPECMGRTEGSIDWCEVHETDAESLCSRCDSRYKVWSIWRCRTCRYARQVPVWFVVLNDPLVVAFLYEHEGVRDLVPFTKLLFEEGPTVTGIVADVVSTDPVTVDVVIPSGDEELHLTLDESLEILETDVLPRREATDASDRE